MESTRIEGTVNDWASRSFPALLVVERYGIDFHDQGTRSFDEVCREKGLDPAAVAAEIEGVSKPRLPVPLDETITLRDLIQHINARHHEYLKLELPRLRARLDRMAMRHPDRDDALLPRLREVFVEIQSDLELHLHKEEDILFPSIARMERALANGNPLPPSPFGSVRNPIGMMEHEHTRVEELLNSMRAIARDYAAPDYACANFRAVFNTLKELEADLHEHIRVENDILHRRAEALERPA
jgi:regulator of cell morphogenesis and NO signaling